MASLARLGVWLLVVLMVLQLVSPGGGWPRLRAWMGAKWIGVKVQMAIGIMLLVVASWIFLRTVRGTPRLANVLLKGRTAAVAAGGTG